MRDRKKRNTLISGGERWRKGTILWNHMIMMASILLLAVLALAGILIFALRTLTDEQLAKMQIILDRNCQQMEDELYMTAALPNGIEGTRYYDYIKGEFSGELDRKYYPVLPLLQRALRNQIYLRGSADLTILYLDGVNSIVTSNNLNFAVAEDCFDREIRFSRTSTERIFAYLRERSRTVVLPTQEVTIGTKQDRYLTLVVHPIDRNVAVMSFYSEMQVLEYLGMPYMPDGCYLKITAQDGQILEEYPSAWDEKDSENYYTLDGGLHKLECNVCLYVPKSYCSELIAPVRRTGTVIIVFVFLLGLTLAFWLSKASVIPIRKLISSHEGGADTFHGNELVRIDEIINRNIERSNELQAELVGQIIAKALTGTVLSADDEQQLSASGVIPPRYQIILLHTGPQRNETLGHRLRAELGELIWAYMDKTETGVIIRASDQTIAQLTELVKTENSTGISAGGEIYCGVSAPAESAADLHMAVYQARVAMPQDPGVHVFYGEYSAPPTLSWLQHERLYQNVYTNNREGALQMLLSISRQATNQNARDLFYNIKFILSSAAAEMKFELPMDDCMDYQPSKLPRENMERLLTPLCALFDAIDAQKNGCRMTQAEEILRYIQKEISCYDLCAQTVADHFEITEKRVYETVRRMVDMSFTEYILSLRMKRAGALLCSTQDSVAAIAQKCGYQGHATFYRLFKKYYGMPPGRFRDMGGAEPEKNSPT